MHTYVRSPLARDEKQNDSTIESISIRSNNSSNRSRRTAFTSVIWCTCVVPSPGRLTRRVNVRVNDYRTFRHRTSWTGWETQSIRIIYAARRFSDRSFPRVVDRGRQPEGFVSRSPAAGSKLISVYPDTGPAARPERRASVHSVRNRRQTSLYRYALSRRFIGFVGRTFKSEP